MLGREPVLWLALVRAIIICVTAFGLKLSAEQIGAVYLVAETALTLITRQQVTSVNGKHLQQ